MILSISNYIILPLYILSITSTRIACTPYPRITLNNILLSESHRIDNPRTSQSFLSLPFHHLLFHHLLPNLPIYFTIIFFLSLKTFSNGHTIHFYSNLHKSSSSPFHYVNCKSIPTSCIAPSFFLIYITFKCFVLTSSTPHIFLMLQ